MRLIVESNSNPADFAKKAISADGELQLLYLQGSDMILHQRLLQIVVSGLAGQGRDLGLAGTFLGATVFPVRMHDEDIRAALVLGLDLTANPEDLAAGGFRQTEGCH